MARETKQFVVNNPNVILTRQTCSQRSSMSTGSKRRAIEFCFSIRICYMFPLSKCRGESGLGLCTDSVPAETILLRGGDFQLKNMFGRKICRSLPMRGGIMFASTEVEHRPRSNSPLHSDIENIWQIRTPKSNHDASTQRLLPADIFETRRWPQVCRFKITFALLLKNCFVSTRTNLMNLKHCLLD